MTAWRHNAGPPCKDHGPEAVCIKCCCQDCKAVPCECSEGKSDITVSGCSDCPARENYDGMGQFCHIRMAEVLKLPEAEHDLPENEVDTDDVDDGKAPGWCPLRRGPFTIRLKDSP